MGDLASCMERVEKKAAEARERTKARQLEMFAGGAEMALPKKPAENAEAEIPASLNRPDKPLDPEPCEAVDCMVHSSALALDDDGRGGAPCRICGTREDAMSWVRTRPGCGFVSCNGCLSEEEKAIRREQRRRMK